MDRANAQTCGLGAGWLTTDANDALEQKAIMAKPRATGGLSSALQLRGMSIQVPSKGETSNARGGCRVTEGSTADGTR